MTMFKSATAMLAVAMAAITHVAGFEDEASWKPSQETQVATNGHADGFSPKPTEAPFHPRYGMMKRAEVGIALSTDPQQCGWWSYKANIYSTLGCDAATNKCITSGSNLGCCSGNCQYGVATACYNYNEVRAGKCPTDDPAAMCCTEKTAPGCWTWKLPIDTKGSESTYTMVNCDYSQGIGTLFATNPADSPSKTSSQSTDTAADATNTASNDSGDDKNGDGEDSGSKKKKTNVGAIAGGVVGGLGAAALIGVAILLLIRRNKAKKNNDQPTGETKLPTASAPSTPGYTHGNMQQWSPPPQQQQQAYAYPPPQLGYPTAPPNGQYDPQMIPAAYHPGQTPSPQGYDPKLGAAAFHPGQTPSPQGYDPRAAYMGQSPPPQQPSPYSPHSPSTGYGYPASVSAAGVTHDGASQLPGTPQQSAAIELAGHEASGHSPPVELAAENPQK